MKDKYISIFDYLGYAGGKELGGIINQRAAALGIPSQYREVSNKTYSGKISLYPEKWLKEMLNSELNKIKK
jgi:hypothetical protein